MSPILTQGSMIVLYFFTLLGLSAFSYSQVDSGMPFNHDLARLMSENRLLAGLTVSLIFISLFICYFYFLRQIKLLSRRKIFFLLFITVLISYLAYPAVFSHDFYNYFIDAKMLFVYKVNPYLTPPANFPNDPIFPYLHWPHATSRYSPLWFLFLGIFYLPFSSNFVLSLFTVKIMFVTAFLISVYLIYRISVNLKINPKLAVVTFIFNPLIIIDCLINPHIDSLTLMFVLLAVWLMLQKNKFLSWLSFFGSVLIKITALPLVIGFWKKNLKVMIYLGYLTAFTVSFYLSISSWYFLLPIGLSVFFPRDKIIRFLMISLSAAGLVRYLPYFYLGYFNPANKIRFILFVVVLVIFFLFRKSRLLKI